MNSPTGIFWDSIWWSGAMFGFQTSGDVGTVWAMHSCPATVLCPWGLLSLNSGQKMSCHLWVKTADFTTVFLCFFSYRLVLMNYISDWLLIWLTKWLISRVTNQPTPWKGSCWEANNSSASPGIPRKLGHPKVLTAAHHLTVSWDK